MGASPALCQLPLHNAGNNITAQDNPKYSIIKRDVTDILTATDAQLVEAMRFYAERMRMIVEPTGCLGLAAVMQMKDALKGKRVGVVISGGNVDLERFCSLLSA